MAGLVRGEMLEPAGVIGSLIGANMNTTGDQAISIARFGLSYVVDEVLVVWRSGASLTLAAGGIYDAVTKGGNAVVAAGQVYSALTGAGKIVRPSLAAFPLANVLTADILYLSLTVAQGAAATVDVYVRGGLLS